MALLMEDSLHITLEKTNAALSQCFRDTSARPLEDFVDLEVGFFAAMNEIDEACVAVVVVPVGRIVDIDEAQFDVRSQETLPDDIIEVRKQRR